MITVLGLTSTRSTNDLRKDFCWRKEVWPNNCSSDLPLEKLLEVQGNKRQDMQEFINLKITLDEKKRLPNILDYERICRMQLTSVFLAGKGVPPRERQWFSRELPRSFYHLRRARNRAEHESIRNWSREELAGFVADFIGIGRPGILPQLAKALF